MSYSQVHNHPSHELISEGRDRPGGECPMNPIEEDPCEFCNNPKLIWVCDRWVEETLIRVWQCTKCREKDEERYLPGSIPEGGVPDYQPLL